MKRRIGLSALRKLERPVALAIGVFDGVHRGHQKVIERCVDEARRVLGISAVLTFHPHPARVVRPETAPPLLTTEEQDRRLFGRLGVELCVTVDFDRHIQQMSAMDFLEHLLDSCPTLRTLVVGHRWHFGKNRDGNFEVLERFARDRGLEAIEVPAVEDGETGEVISSTWIRRLVRDGDLCKVEQLLGRCYAITGTVVAGEGRGKQIGFPTANIRTDNEVLPPSGVYAVRVLVDGREYAGAMNIGRRPTFEHDRDAPVVMEVHLLDFSGSLAGCELEVSLRRRIRDEREFPGVEELRAQIARDVEKVRELIPTGHP